MKVHACVAISALCLFIVSAADAQEGTRVEFAVPLNLSQITPDIATIGVFCTVRSSAIANTSGSSYGISRHTPTNGRVQTTALVRVDILKLVDPAGKSATYTCELQALLTGQNTWVPLKNNTNPVFRISPNPAPITGSFDWVQTAPTADAAPVSATTTSPGGNP